MGAFCGGVLTSLIKRVESRSILNHKHKSVMFLRIPRSLGKLFFFFQFLSLKEELLAAPSLKKKSLKSRLHQTSHQLFPHCRPE